MIRYNWKTGKNVSHELLVESIDRSYVVTSSIHINFKLVSNHNDAGEKIWFLFTPEGEHVDLFYNYINIYLKHRGCSPNTIKSQAYMLKVFFTFLYVMHYKYTDIDKKAKKEYIDFLKTIPGVSIETIKIYLSVVRSFLTALGVKEGAMFDKLYVKKEVRITNSFAFPRMQGCYDPELPRRKVVDVLPPKHISPWEFARLTNYLVEQKETKYLLLAMLGYHHGCRAGECLGMTWEDMITGGFTPRIIIRNRLSDDPSQRAKTQMTPCGKEDYSSTEYVLETESVYGYIPLDADNSLLLLLKRYMTEEQQRIAVNPERYVGCRADTISSDFVGPDGTSQNYYLFSTKDGNRMKYSHLNYWFKKFYTAVNISLQNGIFHKLRHGCGMLHSFYLVPPTSREELMLIMRHKTITASAVYTRIPEQELIKRRMALQQRILHEIPELKLNLDSLIDE